MSFYQKWQQTELPGFSTDRPGMDDWVRPSSERTSENPGKCTCHPSCFKTATAGGKCQDCKESGCQ